MATLTPTSAAPNTSFRSLVVPREHGSWSLALEPVALGLLVAPSCAGAWLALAVVAGFFTRRPLKLALTLPATDARRDAAWRWTILFAAVAIASLFASGSLGMWRNTPHSSFVQLWPLLLAVPFGAAFLWFDLRGEMREAEAELAGSAAFALVPAAFATLASWSAAPALGLAVLMLARSIPTVLTVRTYLRLAKGKSASVWSALLGAAAFLIAVIALAAFSCVPLLASAFVALLVARSALFLSPFAPAWSAKRVGMLEAVLGLTYLAGLAAAYAWR
jgi:hypothetical protein